MAEMKVQHDAEEGRFFLDMDDERAYLYYTEPEPGVVDMKTTFVPTGLRGRGIGHVLGCTALRWANSEGLKVIPSCSFIQRLVEQDTC